MSNLGDRLARAGHPEGVTDAEAQRVEAAFAAVATSASQAETSYLPDPPTSQSTVPNPSPARGEDRGRNGGTSGGTAAGDDGGDRRRSFASSQNDRIEELKASVHAELLKQLGPQLYDVNVDQAELARKV